LVGHALAEVLAAAGDEAAIRRYLELQFAVRAVAALLESRRSWRVSRLVATFEEETHHAIRRRRGAA
jgi:lipid A disaccharide synthetase